MQDSHGFIWIGTWDGLNKYNGYDYIIYNTSNGLSNPTINSLLEDQWGNIWIGTDNGLNRLNKSSGKIRQFHYQPGISNCLSNDFINHIYRDKNNFLWISTTFGLNRYDIDQDIFTLFNFFERNADSSLTNFITRVREDEKGNLWIATRSGIHCYNPELQSFKAYNLQPDFNGPGVSRSNYIQDIAIDDNGQVYAATLNGVFLIHPDHGAIYHLTAEASYPVRLSNNQVNTLLIDLKGLVWIGTSTGLDLFDPNTETLTTYKSGANITNLSNDDIRSIFQDQAGTIWIGTYKGLNKADRSPSRFMHYKADPENPNSLSDNIVYTIVEDRNGVAWIGTFGGINLLDRTTDRYSHIICNGNDPGGLSSNKVRTLVLDSAGYIWAGTESKGISRINPKSLLIRQYRHVEGDSATISEDNILSCYVDSKGRIWVGTVKGGVNIINPGDGSIMHITSNPQSRIQISDNKIWTIYEDRAGNFWLGTNWGLNKLSPDIQTLEVFTHNPQDENTISSDRVFSVHEDDKGIFWLGTMGGGLIRFDPVSGIFKTYAENYGLPNNVVYATLDDGEGNLWLATNWGLSKFNKQRETFINYDTKDGVQGNEFNVGAYFINRKGEMYFGGMSGFNVFHPSEITLNKLPPIMVFTGFRVLNALHKTELESGQTIRLNYDENFFSIEYSALDYTNPPKNLYRYRLENYDDEWVVTNAYQRRAEYRKVDPGTYRFLVTGSNNDGVWNEEGISLTIIIRPPWWQTWMFRLAFVLLMIFLAWSLILVRIKTIRRKHGVEKKMLAIEKQIFELEQKALRLQMNPHFMFNSLNAIQNFVLANDTDKAVNYLAKFSHLMRMILANSTAALITLKDELKALSYYIDLEKLRFDNKFNYVINRDPGIDEEFVEIPPMLFQPYVENAIIHGLVNSPNPGLLEISLKKVNNGTLLCTIQDNGIGREKAIEIRNESGIKRQPKGMNITQERIEIFNRQNRKNFSVRVTDLKDEKGEPAGTRIEFTIQYQEI
jgi:ligand-binding sensor domain-containing protein